MTDRTNVARQDEDPLIGTTAGSWRLQRRIGTGRLATVFAAANAGGKTAAVHVLHDFLADDEALASGYLRAARAMWEHPDSVQLLESGHLPGGAPYVVGELLDGETVARLVERRPRGVSPTEAIRIVRDALVVLASAHEADIVHGDLSPARLFMCEDGTVKLMGFGLSAVRARAAELGAAASPVEVSFAAPERLGGDAATRASDLWSMSAILFRLLTGELVYDGATDAERRASAATRSPRSLSAIVAGAPGVLVRLVERGLSVDPALRFQSARDMRGAAEQLLNDPQLASVRSIYDLESVPPASGPVSTRPADSAGAVKVENKQDGGVVVHPLTSQIPEPARAHRGTADTMPVLEAVRQPTRPRIDDIESQIEALREVFLALETAVAARRHAGATHPSTERAIKRVLEQIQALHVDSDVPVSWSVTQRSFVLGGRSVWEPEGELERIPGELFGGGVRRLELAAGTDIAEVERLVEALQPGATDAGVMGSDLATLIRVAAFPHLSAHLADAFGGNRPGRRNT